MPRPPHRGNRRRGVTFAAEARFARLVCLAMVALALVLGCATRLARAATILPEQVAVLANSADADSVALARHYLAARGIPEKNLVALPLPDTEEISWEVFANQLWNPLIERLVRDGRMRGKFAPATDAAGRRRLYCTENAIRYIVLCRGVPLRIRADDALFEKEFGKTLPRKRGMENTASVDSELALLAQSQTPAAAHVANPLFGQKTFFSVIRATFIIPARLDAPDIADCRRMVDDAVAVEKIGLAGRAYVDIGGPYADGDKWLGAAADALDKTGFDLTRETTRALFQPGCRADAPALYFGWYATHASGRFGTPLLRFEPGAIAAHIHSFSAATLRNATRHWCAPLVSRGAAVTFGNVAEPYLAFTTRPDIFTKVLLRGEQTGEAYAAATPVWSWQTVLVGDPLYRPFKISADAQLRLLQQGPRTAYSDNWRDGVLLRQSRLLLARAPAKTAAATRNANTTATPNAAIAPPIPAAPATQPDTKNNPPVPPPAPPAPLPKNHASAATNLLAAAVHEHSTPALRLALARAAAHPSLAWLDADAVADADPGLILETARYLRQESHSHDAVAAYAALLSRADLPPPLRKEILPEAADTAVAARLHELARQWREEI